MDRKVLRACGRGVHNGLNPRALGAFPTDGYRRDSSRYRGPRLRLRMRRVVHDDGPRILLVRWRVDDEHLRRFFAGDCEGVEHALRAKAPVACTDVPLLPVYLADAGAAQQIGGLFEGRMGVPLRAVSLGDGSDQHFQAPRANSVAADNTAIRSTRVIGRLIGGDLIGVDDVRRGVHWPVPWVGPLTGRTRDRRATGMRTGIARRICAMPLPSASLRRDFMPPPPSACSQTKLKAWMPGTS